MPITDYNDALEAAEQAKAWSTALRKNSQQPQGQMVGKWYVAPSWGQQLLPAVQDVLGGVAEGISRKKSKEAEKGMRTAASEWIQQRPQGTMQPVGPELPGPQPEGTEGPILSNEMVPPTQQSQLEWARQGETNPLTKALAAKYGEDVLIKEPEREEARAFRKHESEAARAAKKEESDAKRAQDLMLARERYEMMTGYYNGILANGAASVEAKKEATAGLHALRQQGLELQAQGLELKHHLGHLSDDTRNRAIDAPKSRLDRKAKADADAADQVLNGLDVTLNKLKKVEDSPVGAYVRGAITEGVPGGERIARGARDANDSEARQMAFNIAGEIQHERYGTALSKYEKGAAQQYIPGPYDDSTAITQKLLGLKELLELNQRRLKLMEGSDLTLEQAQAALPMAAKPPTAAAQPPGAAASVPQGVTVKRVK
jgi:hypothetical protein